MQLPVNHPAVDVKGQLKQALNQGRRQTPTKHRQQQVVALVLMLRPAVEHAHRQVPAACVLVGFLGCVQAGG